jgi:hypothetical protein
MAFDIAEYIRQTGFTQTRKSDKRDIFEKSYYHPFDKRTYTACVTLHYDAGYSDFNSNSIWLMTIEFVDPQGRGMAFNGIAPTTFDQAASIFELILPTKDYLARKEITNA